MAINFSIDNDRVTSGTQDVINDQTAGLQDNDVNVTLSSGELDGLDSGFETFLTGLGLSTAQKDFAVLVDAADSNANFIQISATGGETINGIKLIANSSTATSWTTLSGEALYLHVDGTGNYATLTTASGSGGRIVAAFALTDETVDNVAHTASAGVQYVTFEGISHPDATNPDDTLALGDVLKVAVDTTVSFNFEQLAAGNFLWAAVGDASSAMLITGQDLNVKDTGSPSQIGTKDTSGSTDPTDTVNTSKATDTTIGINAQHFAPTNSGNGATAVFTFVNGYKPLNSATPTYTGDNVKQIDYDGYLNVTAASVFISQVTGSGSTKMLISLWEAGSGGTGDKAPGDLLPEEGYSAPNVTNAYSYIGNQDTDSNLKDDTAVAVASVTIRGFTWNYNDASNGTTQGGITVTIGANNITVDGAQTGDSIGFVALDGASALDGTFNRVDIQALYQSASFDIGHIDLTQGGTTSAGLGSHLFADDDGPTLTPQAAGSLTPNDLQVGNVTVTNDAVKGQDSSSYGVAAGTDGLGSFIIKGPADSSGDFTWAYYNVDGTNGTELNEIKGQYKGSDLYTLELNDDGTYTFKMIGTLPGSQVDFSAAEIKAGAPNTNSIDVGAVGSDEYVTIAGGGGAINESHGFVGVGNGNLDPGESLTLSLHEADGDLIPFTSINIGTKSAQASSYSWVATKVGGGTISGTENVGKNQPIDLSSTDLQGFLIESVTITKISGPAIKIGVDDIHIFTLPDDVQLGFTVELKDGDTDAVTQSFVVDIDGNNDGTFDSNVNALSALPTLKQAGYTADSGMAPSSHSGSLVGADDTSSALKIEALNYLHTPDYYMV